MKRFHGDPDRFAAVAEFVVAEFGRSVRYIADVAGGFTQRMQQPQTLLALAQRSVGVLAMRDVAQHPAQAAEMVLIRLAYASELPSPADLIKQLRENAGANAAAGTPVPNGNGGGGSRAKIAVGGAAVAVATQAIAQQTVPQTNPDMQPMPTSC